MKTTATQKTVLATIVANEKHGATLCDNAACPKHVAIALARRGLVKLISETIPRGLSNRRSVLVLISAIPTDAGRAAL